MSREAIEQGARREGTERAGTGRLPGTPAGVASAAPGRPSRGGAAAASGAEVDVGVVLGVLAARELGRR